MLARSRCGSGWGAWHEIHPLSFWRTQLGALHMHRRIYRTLLELDSTVDQPEEAVSGRSGQSSRCPCAHAAAISTMADADDQQLARFLEATHCTVDQAQFFLEASGGNYDRAVTMYYGKHGC